MATAAIAEIDRLKAELDDCLPLPAEAVDPPGAEAEDQVALPLQRH